MLQKKKIDFERKIIPNRKYNARKKSLYIFQFSYDKGIHVEITAPLFYHAVIFQTKLFNICFFHTILWEYFITLANRLMYISFLINHPILI